MGKIAGRCAATGALIVLFCFVPATLFIQNISGSSGIQSLIDAASLGSPATNHYYGDATPIYSAPGSVVCVAFEFLGLDSASSEAVFGIVVGATQQGYLAIQSDMCTG